MRHLDRFANGSIAQGYVRMVCWEEKTGRITFDSKGHNTVVNDARRSAAAAFAGIPGNVGLGFKVKQYRLGYSNVLVNHWDTVNNKPLEAPFTLSEPLIEYPGFPVSPNQDFFHTQADISGLAADGLHYVGPNSPLAQIALPVGVTYPFNGDEMAVSLDVQLPSNVSTDATFDTVEVILANGRKFAHRWVYPITKQPGWGMSVQHLILF